MRSIRLRLAVIVGAVLAPLSPWLVFRSTRLTGGDFDGHVWVPWFLRHYVLSGKGGFGWSDQWFTGFPVLRYYFPAPAWLVALVSLVIDPDIAFKVIVLASIAAIPFAVAHFARTAGVDGSTTIWIAAGTAAWLLDPQYEILGGNILSTMAGEYSYSLSVSLGFVFLRSHIRSLRAEKWSPAAGLLCGLGILTHVFPTAAAVVMAIAWTLFTSRGPNASLETSKPPFSSTTNRITGIRRTIASGLVALGVSAWWLVPFISEAPLAMIDIGWDRTTDIVGLLIPATVQRSGWIPFTIAQVLAVVALVLVVVRRERSVVGHALRSVTFVVGVLWVAGVLVVAFVPQGRLWNERMLPWWVMATWLLGGIGAARVQQLVLARWKQKPDTTLSSQMASQKSTTPTPALKPSVLKPSVLKPTNQKRRLLAAFPVTVVVVLAMTQTGVITAIAPTTDWGDAVTVGRREFGGWEARSTYAEQAALVQHLRKLGPGTVLADWDPEWTEDAGELWMATLPIDTNGVIRAAEGVLYESSASLPFLLQAQQLFTNEHVGSMRALENRFDPVVGARLAADLGIRYLLIRSSEVAAVVLSVNSTIDRGRTGGFHIIELQPGPVVEPLTTEPIVVTRMGGTQEGGWIDVAMASWLPWGALSGRATVVSGGPSSWPRGDVSESRVIPDMAEAPAFGEGVIWQQPAPKETPVANPPSVTNVTKSPNGKITFSVTRAGTPVKIRTPWSPRLRASGADGPWRAGPNHVVVVPTETNVRLSLQTPTWEWALRVGSVCTLVFGLGAFILQKRFRQRL